MRPFLGSVGCRSCISNQMGLQVESLWLQFQLIKLILKQNEDGLNVNIPLFKKPSKLKGFEPASAILHRIHELCNT